MASKPSLASIGCPFAAAHARNSGNGKSLGGNEYNKSMCPHFQSKAARKCPYFKLQLHFTLFYTFFAQIMAYQMPTTPSSTPQSAGLVVGPHSMSFLMNKCPILSHASLIRTQLHDQLKSLGYCLHLDNYYDPKGLTILSSSASLDEPFHTHGHGSTSGSHGNGEMLISPSVSKKVVSLSHWHETFKTRRFHSPSSSTSSLSLDTSTPSAAPTSASNDFTKKGLSAISSSHHSVTSDELMVIGLSHHNAGVSIREKLAIPEEEWNTVAAELTQLPSISEAAILSTCNRFEVYIATSNRYQAFTELLTYFNRRTAGGGKDKELSISELRENLFMLTADDAAWHLLRVSGGLESLVVGEGQILSQVKKAYEKSLTTNGGSGGKIVSKMFNTAVTGGKRVRCETEISKGAVSVSSAAAEYTAMKLKEVSHLEMQDANIVILGAGKMSRLLMAHLQSQGVKKVQVVNRSPERIDELAVEFPNITIVPSGLDTMWETIREADIVFPSTKSNITLVDPEPLSQCLQNRQRPSPLHFMDISVPRNVHPECDKVKGVYCYNVDHLKAVVQKNTAKRKTEMMQAETILQDELNKFLTWQQSLEAIPTILKLQEKAEQLRQEALLKAKKKLCAEGIANGEGNLGGTAAGTVVESTLDALSKGIVSKMLHGPLAHLRQQPDLLSTHTAISQLQLAFQL